MSGADKLFAPLAGRPLLAHVLAPFQQSTAIDRVVLVLSSANLERGRDLVAEYRIEPACDWVLVHDGARLLLSPSIAAGLEAARETGAAVPAIPITDTVKAARPDGAIDRTLDRSGLWAAQTPQVFRHDLLLRAHREVTADVTDDAAMLEVLGLPVKLYAGSSLNIKVTNIEDLRTAGALLQEANRS
jgi:2-C-methyl-D-erythritol 4-phosphate cytidylyltransferase